MEQEKAIKRAEAFLNQMNLENRDKDKFKWVLTKPIDVGSAWYFDFTFQLIDPEENVGVGGAPGFQIDKETGAVETVSWEDYHSRI